ncbi:MAG: TatD family hydrolase [Alphaproteobacteria bacterium]|nr:TatD family hydrolase [Alphaproteobacteria bacterium]
MTGRPLVDSHCHLDYLARDGGDLAGVLARARGAGVGTMLTIGTKLREFDIVRAIAEANSDVVCSVGIHPHEAGSEATDVAQLVALAAHPKVVGIGETGLDYFYDKSPRQQQQQSFRTHLAAARATGLPVIVHTRDADDDTAAMLSEAAGQGPLTGVLHCFTSSLRLARHALDLGFYISISGIVTFKNAEDLRATVRQVPLDRLLVETDAPYLAPVPVRGKSCEPAFVVHTAARVAEIKGVSPPALAEATTANFFTLFARARAATSVAA